MTERISREKAKEVIDAAESGILVAVVKEPKPSIGAVPDDEEEYIVRSETYQFGNAEYELE